MNPVIPDIILGVQVVSFIMYIIIIILGLIWMKTNRNLRYMELPVMVLVLNLMIFYVASWLSNGNHIEVKESVVVFTSWSAFLRLQTAITFLGAALMRVGGEQVKKYIICFLKLPFDLFHKIKGIWGKL